MAEKAGTSSMHSSSDQDYMVVPKKEVFRCMTECLMKAGLDSEIAEIVAHHLIKADYRGIFAFGLNRLGYYLDDIEQGVVDVKAKPKVLNDFQAIALVDGCNAIGAVIGNYCMQMAIEKAHRFGIGFVSARGCNPFGFCGYYTLMAVERGMLGFCCTNTSPLVCPTRTNHGGIGTNPMSLGMPASGGDEFILDMAHSMISLAKIEIMMHKGMKIPPGCAYGLQGNPTTDPREVMKSKTLMPLGGEESTSGYKGYGLAMMVEVLCGILSGSEYGPNIRSWPGTGRVANLGQCFMAINPDVCAPGSKNRLSQLLKQLRGLPHYPDSGSVIIPGDGERETMNQCDADGGIRYPPRVITNFKKVAKKLGVQPIKLVKRKSSYR